MPALPGPHPVHPPPTRAPATSSFFPPRELRDLQLHVHTKQQTLKSKIRYAVRSEAEGAVNEFAHGHCMRRCRHREQGKGRIQHVLTAIAVNIQRLSGLTPTEEAGERRFPPRVGSGSPCSPIRAGTRVLPTWPKLSALSRSGDARRRSAVRPGNARRKPPRLVEPFPATGPRGPEGFFGGGAVASNTDAASAVFPPTVMPKSQLTLLRTAGSRWERAVRRPR
ncbi:transposase [Streptomyces sp. NPDC051985]|uniref:transposase n=1 Tax=Streptomyces sp. NPDC051985 TaxID=3155807 RepID=UPI00343C26E3